MTTNQKIAIGCGSVGCLALIVVVVAGVIIWYVMPSRSNRVYNVNVNSNTNSNRNSNVGTNRNSGSSSNRNSSGAASSMSDEDKHKLYQAAITTGDQEILRRVSVKLGLMDEDFTPGDQYVEFVKNHAIWVFQNGDFIREINSKEKAIAYVNEHMPN